MGTETEGILVVEFIGDATDAKASRPPHTEQKVLLNGNPKRYPYIEGKHE